MRTGYLRMADAMAKSGQKNADRKNADRKNADRKQKKKRKNCGGQ